VNQLGCGGKGCRGCVGLLVGIAMLAGSIGLCALVLGWVDGEPIGLVLVAVVLVTNASRRGGAAKRTRPDTDLRSASIRLTQTLRHELHPSHAGPPWTRDATAAVPSTIRRAGGLRRTQGPKRRAVRTDLPIKDRGPRARDAVPARLRFDVLQRDSFRCRYCGRLGSAPGVVLHIDHVVPLVAGGATAAHNLVTACEECNLGKATRSVVGIGP